MKCISIWNPWATLVVHGHKTIETRTWTAPASLIGRRIGIASTKTIRADQRAACGDPIFQRFFLDTNLPDLDVLPNGYLLGTATLEASELITQEFMDNLRTEELAFGWFSPGRYAWRLSKPQLIQPLRVRGMQGMWTLPDEALAESDREDSRGAGHDWRDLSDPERHNLLSGGPLS